MEMQERTIEPRVKPTATAAAGDGEKKKRGRPSKVREVPAVIEGLTAGHGVVQIPLAQIDLTDKTWQFRVSLRVGDLQESIRLNGQQLPVVLRRVSGRELLQIISGFRRTTAIHSIGWTMVHGIVLDDVSDEAAFRLSVLENEKRKTYSDLDRAYAITKYRQMGLTVGNIAGEVFGLSRKQIERLEKLTKLPDYMQAAVEEGELSATTALALKQLHDKAPEGAVDLAAWTRKVADDNISVRNLRTSVLKAMPAKAAGPSLFSTKSDDKSGGTVIRFKPIRVNLSTIGADERSHIVGELEALLAQMRG